MLLFQLVKLFLQIGAYNKRILLELLLLQHFENRMTACSADGVTTEGVEVASTGQHLSNLRCCHDGSYRYAIPDTLKVNNWKMSANGLINWRTIKSWNAVMHEASSWRVFKLYLCHGNYVWDNTVAFKSPEVASSSCNTRLNFVSNAETTGFPYYIICCWQVSWC